MAGTRKRLKAGKELTAYREEALKAQKGIDPITGMEILAAALDHDHDTGHTRAVLDIRSNAWEGKVRKAFIRCGLRKINANYSKCLRNLANYLDKDWKSNPLHPTHRTPDQIRILRNKRARRARAKKNDKDLRERSEL